MARLPADLRPLADLRALASAIRPAGGGRRDGPRLASWALELGADWTVLLLLLSASHAVGGVDGPGHLGGPGILLVAWLLPHFGWLLLGRMLRLGRSVLLLSLLARAATVAVIVLAGVVTVELLWLGAFGYAALAAVGGSARARAVTVGGSLVRVMAAVGPIAAALLLLMGDLVAAAAALVALSIAAMALLQATPAATGPDARSEAARGPAATGFDPLPMPRPLVHLAAGLAAGSITGSLLAGLPALIGREQGHVALVGLAVALVGLGGWVLALPLGRFYLRLPAQVIGVLLVVLMALMLALLPFLGWLAWSVPLVALGAALGSLERGHVTWLRRLAGGPRRLLLASVTAGQLLGALVVGLFGLDLLADGGTLPIVAAAAALVAAGAALAQPGWLRPQRYPQQRLSWDARPAARPLEPQPNATRAARLGGWIGRQVDLELVDVSLPISGRQYAIARPQEASRELLFDEGRADPDKQMPFWAKVWPSGVALADVIVERAAEVRDREVLELGAGLGVTACTALQEGARLTVADYSLLPLSLCRYNGLVNTGRAARTTCFNWRSDEQVADVLRRRPQIGLILAADVLYEGRDVMPLLRVIERLLAEDGSLWLAEPVRRTAARFLDVAAESGWSIDSGTIRAEWPDDTDGRVNVHVISRADEPALSPLQMGGWRG